ncbi:MAG: BolA family protein [Hyphomicrobiales bacterium]|jgi:BolA protein
MRVKLEPLHPIELEIKDVSDDHKGHAGWREGGETHFHIYIVSNAFINKSKLECHKIINELLSEEIKNIHSLSISTKR